MRIRSVGAALTVITMTATTLFVTAEPASAAAFDYCTDNVAILASRGGPVSTERDYSGSNANMLRGRGAPAIGPWEEYRICWPDSSEPYVNIYSQSAHMFVSAEYDYSGSRTGELRARASTPGPWETFRIYCIDNGYSVAILGHFWVSEENDYTGSSAGMLRARATDIGPWEKFRIYDEATLTKIHYLFPCIS